MEIINCHKQEPFKTKDGSEIRKVLEPSNSSVKNQSLAEATIPPGESTDKHSHPKSEEIYYILSGNGTMQIEDETHDVEPHDGIAILPGKRHKLTNTGKTPLVLLCSCSPPYSHEDTVIM